MLGPPVVQLGMPRVVGAAQPRPPDYETATGHGQRVRRGAPRAGGAPARSRIRRTDRAQPRPRSRRCSARGSSLEADGRPRSRRGRTLAHLPRGPIGWRARAGGGHSHPRRIVSRRSRPLSRRPNRPSRIGSWRICRRTAMPSHSIGTHCAARPRSVTAGSCPWASSSPRACPSMPCVRRRPCQRKRLAKPRTTTNAAYQAHLAGSPRGVTTTATNRNPNAISQPTMKPHAQAIVSAPNRCARRAAAKGVSTARAFQVSPAWSRRSRGAER